jgi:hypothetical protein
MYLNTTKTMALKLQKQLNDVSVLQMKDGEIAIITRWDASPCYINAIVQRHGLDLLALGHGVGTSWRGIFLGEIDEEALRVRILPKGTTFILE